ncbi:hypothetical protein JAAARDRAFT_616711 [Jaapia argillacea MUCL 33604]|uniref:Uncharacterized protein n=1 Tax=Jaapia argillacea MUCL 33604 TaxID=933084 RepID=A0A067P799_9AGAM|nr:hypothetical protein JAAARDRAFT_616711 [Jaapia argillacea MUCL 33604]
MSLCHREPFPIPPFKFSFFLLPSLSLFVQEGSSTVEWLEFNQEMEDEVAENALEDALEREKAESASGEEFTFSSPCLHRPEFRFNDDHVY